MRRSPLVARLLKSSEPSIRWKTRLGVLGENPRSASNRALRETIRRSPRVQALLSHSAVIGRPGTYRAVYYKWQGLHWVLARLADLGYPPGDRRLEPLRDRVLDLWLGPYYFTEFEAGSKSAAYARRGVPRMRGRYRRCASQQGNALYFVTELGLDDGRGERLVERLLHWQWPDGGWNCDRDPDADTSSFHETLTPMIGLATFAKARGAPNAARGAARASEVFLERRMFRRRSDGRVIHPEFLRLHYPVYWHYDLLAGLRGIVATGRIDDPRCAEALTELESKQLPSGGWAAEGKFYRVSPHRFSAGCEYVDWGGVRSTQMNEWVTVDALSVLTAAGRLDPL
jgi:hypothetical protein